jgi:hypothetical protein
MLADIAGTDGAEERIRDRMGEDVSVRMTR